MTALDFKKEYHYSRATGSGIYSCMYCSRQVREGVPGKSGCYILCCGANRGHRFKVKSGNTCDLCIPGIWDAMYECLSGVRHECKRV